MLFRSQAIAPVEDVAKRYDKSLKQAIALKYQAQYILEKLNISID